MLRMQLIVEEVAELCDAMGGTDRAALLRELCDVRYVVDGLAIELGLHHVYEHAILEVHRANMTKLVDGKPCMNEAGRVVKPEGFVPPNMQQFVD
jgi:predicted HAD superfamily Cof-like phosphohydrolase